MGCGRRVNGLVLLASLVSTSTAAADPLDDAVVPEVVAPDVRNEIPNLAYTYSATGASAGSVGVQAYGIGLVGPSGSYAAPNVPASPPMAGGGISAWWSPVDRLTLVGDGGRDVFGNFSPSGAAVLRLLGKSGDGFSLGALGKFKVEGFAGGPNANEIESEIEAGVLASYAKRGLHLDANGIGGRGTGPEGEMDVEGRVRAGYDATDFMRLGVDSQARFRVAGTNKLVGDRTWDFAAGPQVLFGMKPFFGAVTAGPTTMNIARSLGWSAIITVGGTTF
jgi:hypothetical protein